jgi:NADH:ubiquinone oxidoreductase subunit K
MGSLIVGVLLGLAATGATPAPAVSAAAPTPLVLPAAAPTPPVLETASGVRAWGYDLYERGDFVSQLTKKRCVSGAMQIMVKGAMLALILAGRAAGQPQIGQAVALTVIVADTIVSVVALALAVQVRRSFGTLDAEALTTLRR